MIQDIIGEEVILMVYNTHSNTHRQRFLKDHPDLKPVAGDEFEVILRNAVDKKIFEFIVFQDEEFYTDFHLTSAKIWDEKRRNGIE